MHEARPAARDRDEPVPLRTERPASKVSPRFFQGESALRKETSDLLEGPGPGRKRGLERASGRSGRPIAVTVRRAPESAAAGRPPGLGDFELSSGVPHAPRPMQDPAFRPVESLQNEPAPG